MLHIGFFLACQLPARCSCVLFLVQSTIGALFFVGSQTPVQLPAAAATEHDEKAAPVAVVRPAAHPSPEQFAFRSCGDRVRNLEPSGSGRSWDELEASQPCPRTALLARNRYGLVFTVQPDGVCLCVCFLALCCRVACLNASLLSSGYCFAFRPAQSAHSHFLFVTQAKSRMRAHLIS